MRATRESKNSNLITDTRVIDLAWTRLIKLFKQHSPAPKTQPSEKDKRGPMRERDATK